MKVIKKQAGNLKIYDVSEEKKNKMKTKDKLHS